MQKARAKELAPVRYNKVVITGVSDEWTDELLHEEIGAVYIRRIKRRVDGQLQPTTAVILGYTEDPPEVVKLRYRQYRTRTYVEEPKQCHNCLRFGHLKANCRSTTRCPRCAGSHSYDECTKKDQQAAVRCANCGESHSAKYRGCTKFNEVKQVLTVAAATRVSYADALRDIRTTKKQTSQSVAGNRSTVADKKETADMATQTETVDIGTQTDAPAETIMKEIQKAADKTMRDVIAIMNESLRRLHDSIGKDVSRNYTLLETHYSGYGSAIQQTTDAVSERLQIVDRAIPSTTQDIAIMKQQLHSRLASMTKHAQEHFTTAQLMNDEKQQQQKKPAAKQDAGQRVA